MVTLNDCIRYYKVLGKRAQTNLENAIKRGDRRAVDNINRKIEIYKLTIECLQKPGDSHE